MKSELGKVAVNSITGCHVWIAAKANGYGRMYVDGRLRPAHRVYWERKNGQVPNGLQLDHLCRNRACVNPSHLEAVTQTVNLRRAIAKVSLEDVSHIRLRYHDGESARAIAKTYRVTDAAINSIVRGDSWKDADGPIRQKYVSFGRKLTASQVGLMLSAKASGARNVVLARQFGVSRERVRQIVKANHPS